MLTRLREAWLRLRLRDLEHELDDLHELDRKLQRGQLDVREEIAAVRVKLATSRADRVCRAKCGKR